MSPHNMESPFATWKQYLDNIFNVPDDATIARRRYAQCQLRIHRQHSTSKSHELKYQKNTQKKQNYVHTTTAGTLMSPKAVFTVRFQEN